MAPESSSHETAYPLGAHCPLAAGNIQLRSPYRSELIPSFLGRIPEAARTLDLPLLHAFRPHFLPPCLLLPTHTFLLPIKAPSCIVSPVSPIPPHVLDCSFMPSLSHCLVCSCTGGAGSGSVFSLDLHACRVIQAFTLSTETLTPCQPLCTHASVSTGETTTCCRLCRTCPCTSPHASLGCHATCRVSCVTMHRDSSCPLLFLGTSGGDVLAYDLRFPGGSFRPSPCLFLRGAHHGLVSGVRAASGPLLPSHFFFTSGMIDGWIKLFDLRFPFHYSACKGLDATTCVSSRGYVPYPVEAVHPNSSFSAGVKESSSAQTHHRGCGSNCLDAAHVREIGSATRPIHKRTCVCGSSRMRSTGGIAGMDLSPDGALLAVAHVRTAPPGVTEAEHGYPPQVNTPVMLPQSKLPMSDVKASSLSTLATVKDADRRAVGELSESEHSDAERRTVAGHRDHRWREGTLRSMERPPSVRRQRRWRSATLKRTQLEGETVIFSVSEGLRVLKTFAVADGCAFTGVEFSTNGKHLLQTGGVTSGAVCMICQSCACCCNVYDFTSGYKCHDEEDVGELLASSLSSQDTETHSTRAQRTATVPFCVERSRLSAERRRKTWVGTDDEGSEQESSKADREDADRPSCRTEAAQESSHRAQIVNLIQCNRVALLKSPADGALAFADTSVMKHDLTSKGSERLRGSDTHANLSTVPDYRIPTIRFGPDRSSAVAVNIEDPNDYFTLKVHVSECRSQVSSLNHNGGSHCRCNSSAEMIHSTLPLHFKLYSPSSSLMDRRRQAFWQTGAGRHSSWLRSGHFKSKTVRCRTGELVDMVQKPSRRRRHEQIPPFSSAFSSTLGEFISSARGSAVVFRGMRKLGQAEHQAVLQRKQLQRPFPRCHSQSSLFLNACGVLHPQWGRHDCYRQQFLCTFWGGLVAGIGGSRVYPGLKLWHPATGVVLTCAEGPLATQQAIRCVRGHPDLSLGILATGGSVRLQSGALAIPASQRSLKRNSCMQHARNSLVHASGGINGVSGRRDTSTSLRLSRLACAAVTLWSLEHRDEVLESALEVSKNSFFDKGSLLLDPSDEE